VLLSLKLFFNALRPIEIRNNKIWGSCTFVRSKCDKSLTNQEHMRRRMYTKIPHFLLLVSNLPSFVNKIRCCDCLIESGRGAIPVSK